MKTTMTVICLCLLLTAGSVQGAGPPFEPAQVVGPEACWSPAAQAIEKIRMNCTGLAGTAFEACFVAGMQQSGASPKAVAFTESIGSMGYLEEHRQMGSVSIAFVVYPFRANENQGFLLISGATQMIDVDDLTRLSAEDLKKDPLYPRLKKQYPAAALWQGDRSGKEYPLFERRADGVQRFIVRYRLLNGCHACELAGYARYAFDFDRTGHFSGTAYLGIEKPAAGRENNAEAFSDPSTPVSVRKGQTFALTLRANPTTGYIWQLAETPDGGFIQFIGHEYRSDKTGSAGRAGAGGREIWTFRAAASGETTIALKYVRPWETNAAPGKSAQFKIIVTSDENKK
jgi:predicted secreted protein